MYEEKNNAQNNRFTSNIYNKTRDGLGVNIVQKIYEETIKHPKYNELFPENDKIKLKDRTIKKIVELFENYDLSLTAFDVKGESFEYFLSSTFTGGLGEYFTPRNVVEFMVDVINPKIGEKIVDPFCGTGGFLIYAFDVINEKIRLQDFSDEEKEKWQEELSNRSLFGIDWKERTIQACKMNMIVHGDGHTGIHLNHGLVNIPKVIDDNIFNICLTNPPFGSTENDKKILNNFDLGKGRESQEREVLAIERTIRLVKPENGRVGIVIVEGIFNTKKYDYVRDYIRQHTWINAIVSLNYDTFSGYGAKATTSLLFFIKKKKPDDGKQKDIFMAVCENTGYSSSGLEIPGNELPEILFSYKKFIDEGKHDFDSNRIFVITGDKLKERLDPQHYMSQIKKVKTNLTEVINAKEKLQNEFKDIEKIYNEFFKSKLINLDNITDWDTLIINDLVDEYRVSETVKSNQDYTLVGVSGNALGAFLKDTKKGKAIKANKLFKTKQGCLIYNRLFAHKNSFAILDKEIYDNCYVSGEFPQFMAKETKYNSKNLIKYLFYYCINPVFVDEVRKHSTGSTKMSRFRLNQKNFINFKIRIPSNPDELDMIVEKIDNVFITSKKIKEIQKTLEDTIDKLKEKYVMTFP